MREEVFELDLDLPSSEAHVQSSTACDDAEPVDTSGSGQQQGNESEVVDEYLENLSAIGPSCMAASLPVAIPMRKSAAKESSEDVSGPGEFVPPHILSYRQSFSTFAGSLPLSSSSRIRARTRILQSTGMLAMNSKVGFLVSRTGEAAKDELRKGTQEIPTEEQIVDETTPRRSTGEAG